ncbi:MAG: hypothetical protein ABIV50_07265 [Opitutus sp.]
MISSCHGEVRRIAQLDVKAHPSSDGPQRLPPPVDDRYCCSRSGENPDFGSLATLLWNISDTIP